ncbi:hypothetical protein DF186_16625, partial [Enterococcus hirae]
AVISVILDCFKLHQNNVKTRPMRICEGIVDTLNAVAMATCQTLTFVSCVFGALNKLRLS